METKLKVKLLFIIRDFYKIGNQIKEEESIIDDLSIHELESILKYAQKAQDEMLTSIILKRLVKTNSSKLEERLNKYLYEFFEMALSKPIFLYQVAQIFSYNPNKYVKEIETIKKNILNRKSTQITICINFLNGFYSEKFINKVIEKRNPCFILFLLREANHKQSYQILTKYIALKPSANEIFYLKAGLKGRKLIDFITIILTADVSSSLKSQYLIAIYKSAKDETLKKQLIYEVLELNQLLDILSLMSLLSSQEQALLSEIYLKGNNTNIILALACTTNSLKTYELINKVLEINNFHDLLMLLYYIRAEFLDYVLSMLKNQIPLYLHLINKLYLLGSNRYLKMIKYIYENNQSFPQNKLNELLEFTNKENLERTRKRT